MNVTSYMLEVYLKISVKVIYLNYLGYTQQTISVKTLMSNYHFLKILVKKRLWLCKSAKTCELPTLNLHGIRFEGKKLVIEKVKTLPKSENINEVNQNICPQTQPSKLDFDFESTVASRPLQRIKSSYWNAINCKKAILHYFQVVPRGMNIKKLIDKSKVVEFTSKHHLGG